MDNAEHIIDIFAKAGGIAGLVILLLFILIGKYLSDIQKTLAAMALQSEEHKNELQLQIEKTKSCVLKIMYEFNMCQDRRRRDKPVKIERRNTDL
jgi:hypothetical protein